MSYLAAAKGTGDWLLATAQRSPQGWFWPVQPGVAGCGLLTGIGGWAVVLHELADAADDDHADALARRVLETVAAHASVTDDGGHWHDLTEMVWGTAGIGCLMLTLGAHYLGPAAVP